MNSKFVNALVASLFATFAMTGCIADSQTELDSDVDADSDIAPDDDALETGDDAVSSGGANATSSCYKAIVSKPASVKTSWSDTHVFTRYLKIDQYNMHVVGTASVSNWMMRQTCLFNEAMVSALRNATDRAKMSGFVAHIGTFQDPPRDAAGHYSGGGNGVTLICEDMVGDASKQNWQVPVHEMGHAIEYTLGLQNSSDDVFKKIAQNKYEPKNSREYFAWSTQDWFGCRKTRSEMHLLARTYFRTRIFNNQNTWMPKCLP